MKKILRVFGYAGMYLFLLLHCVTSHVRDKRETHGPIQPVTGKFSIKGVSNASPTSGLAAYD